MCQIKAICHIPRKLDPVQEGHFRITRVAHPGSYQLEEMDGKPLQHSWNIANLRNFTLNEL